MAFQGYNQHTNQDQPNAGEISICIAFLKSKYTDDYTKDNHQIGCSTVDYGSMGGNDLERQPVGDT